MDGRLSKTCTNLRVVPADLLDALCSLSGRPSPPAGGHLSRCVHEHVLHAVASLPVGSLQPGDVSAATEVRAGLLNADVPSASDAAARCIQQTVDDLGPADLWTLARDTAMTLDELAWGATATLAGERLAQPDPLDVLAAQAIVDELAERTPCRWGRQHTDAVRAALHRTLADLADVLLEASESTPTLLDWTAHDGGWRASAVIGGVIHHVALQKGSTRPLPHSPSGTARAPQSHVSLGSGGSRTDRPGAPPMTVDLSLPHSRHGTPPSARSRHSPPEDAVCDDPIRSWSTASTEP